MESLSLSLSLSLPLYWEFINNEIVSIEAKKEQLNYAPLLYKIIFGRDVFLRIKTYKSEILVSFCWDSRQITSILVFSTSCL